MGAKNMISHSFRIAWKDLLELFRNRMGLVLLILMPIFMMVMVGFIYPSETSISNVPVALVNEDVGFGNYSAGSAFIMALDNINDNTGMLSIATASNLDEVREMIQNGDVVEVIREGDVYINEAGEYSASAELVDDYSYYEEHMDEWLEPPMEWEIEEHLEQRRSEQRRLEQVPSIYPEIISQRLFRTGDIFSPHLQHPPSYNPALSA